MSIWENVRNAAYNLDRAIASLFGAPPQETISSESGRHAHHNEVAALLCKMLNVVDPGHCDHAVQHAEALDKADDGVEK